MEREKLVLSKKDAQELAWGDGPADFKIIENVLYDTTRWSECYRIVIQRVSDGKFFADTYSRGATEYQDEQPFQDSDPHFTEVFAKEKVITVYE